MLLAIVLTEPAAAGVYTVPRSIRSDCKRAVDKQINGWLQSLPDGSTAQFRDGGCYGQDGTITLGGRKDLVIDGRGSEFRALTPGDSHRANWRLVGGSNLTLRDMAVRGTNPQGVYDHAVEWQHGYSIEGVQGMTLDNVQARETGGDGIDLWHGAASPACGDDASSARDVRITGATLERNGRQGLAIIDAENVRLESSTVGPVSWSNVDVETDDDCEIARHITVAGNQFGANRYGVIANVGFGGYPQVWDVSATNNTQTAVSTAAPAECYAGAPVRILSPVDPTKLRRRQYTFRGNHFLTRTNGFEFRQVDGVEVSSNTVNFAQTGACSTKRAGVLLVDSPGASITSNVFSGATSVYTADTPSAVGLTAEGNSTN